MQSTLTTERLLLRPIRSEDAAVLFFWGILDRTAWRTVSSVPRRSARTGHATDDTARSPRFTAEDAASPPCTRRLANVRRGRRPFVARRGLPR